MMQTALPPFTVLTGINGSGKSHLLEAIKAGTVGTNLTDSPATEIGFFDWNSLVPNDVGVANLTQIHSHRDWFINQVRSRKADRLPHLLELLARHGIDKKYASRPWDAVHASEEDLKNIGVSQEKMQQAIADLRNFEQDIKSHLKGSMGDDLFKRGLFQVLTNEGHVFHRLEALDFDRQAFTSYGPSLFQHSFGELFFGYFDKQRANVIGEYMVTKGQQPTIAPLTQDAFVAKHGRPPWDFVNDMLARAKLDFRIDQPTDLQATEYLPTLTKVSSGDVVQFSALSSGEKILMSFAFCLYNSTDKRQNIKRPKLLLFDEIDAPLHPSMSRVLVSIINDVLVQTEGIPVIMVTHAPSTVAVSPDESIHLVTANPTRISRESKRRAVSFLTAEIPTMSIDFSGRRQVFVESDYDAERYQSLFQVLAPFIQSGRSLSFIGMGYANMGTGCAQVIRTVTALAEAKNTSVLGLVDWDTQNSPTERVHVLGFKARYAIENYLLDPLLLAAALLNVDPNVAASLNLELFDTFAGFSGLTHAKLQAAHDAAQARVLAAMKVTGRSDPVQATYFGGLVLNADRRYHLAHGHALEDFVKEAFPQLRRFHQTGQLLHYIVENVARNHPKLVPKDIGDALLELCDVDL
jgi:ABC-type molybdenum transport system ATPase subunit/photorepair protein PhrA